jgi:two-component system cell cycle sensor histidine kinase/response regulator CckA
MVDNEELHDRLREAEETLNAIRSGSVDALVISGPQGEQVYTLEGADHTYRRLVEEMSEGAVVITADGDILYSNRCFAEMVRLPLDGVIGRPLRQFFSDRDHATLEALLSKALKDRGAEELLLNTDDGDRVPAYLSATGVQMAGVTAVCLIVTNLTEQKRSQQMVAAGMKRLEEEQSKANKLESLGIVAGGLAHDLNNSLTAILGNISLAKRSVRSNEDTLKRLGEAETFCLQARDVTEQLLTFSKGGVPVKQVESVARLLKDWVGFALSGSNLHCEFDFDPGLWCVDVDRAQMSRVFNNLLINAQQAMPEGGTVVVRATNVTLGAGKTANTLPLPDGKYVRIEIEDTGTGIPETHLPRIFDPYFTTKQRGSGLGLSIAYSVVRSHNGYITVESKPGAGTTFHIYLPASLDAPAGATNLPQPARPGRLRVLVLDDQPAIRQVVRDILVQTVGGEVEFAEDGLQAIEVYEEAREAGKPFDVVLMDLTIPGGMGGKEAIKRLLEIDPVAKAIVVSGYSNDPIMSQYRDYGFQAVIRKPFEVDDLLDTLRAVTATSE